MWTGDLREHGSFSVHGNASGDILRCQQPHLLRLTWVLGPGMATEVEVRLTSGEDNTTVVELEHTTPAEVLDELVRTYGPGGTIGVGAGWDIALLGLDLLLHGTSFDVATWEDSKEVRAFAVESCRSWGDVVKTAWNVDGSELDAAIAFAPESSSAGTP